MKIRIAPSNQGRLDVALGGELTIAHVGALKSTLAERWDGQAPMLVDLSEVERIDSAGLQLLLALAWARGDRLPITGCSQATLGLMDLYRVRDRFLFSVGPSE